MKGPCPRCGVPLAEHQAASALLSGCLSCGGVFLDHETRNKVVTTLDGEVVAAAALAGAHAASNPDLRARVACPSCSSAMAVQKIAGGIIIDVCDRHGAWFDRGELSQLVSALTEQRKGAAGSSGKRGALIAGAAVAGTAAVVGVAALAASSSVVEDVGHAAVTSGASIGDVVEVTANVAGGIFELLGALADL